MHSPDHRAAQLDFAVTASRPFAGVHKPHRQPRRPQHEPGGSCQAALEYFAGQFGGSKRVELQAKVEKKISKELEALAYDWCKHHGCTGTQCSSHAGAFPL